MSSKSERTNLTYVIESCTHFSNETQVHSDQELTESSPRDSRMTFGGCNGDSEHSVGVKETSASPARPTEACSSNVETSGRGAERETFRISRSCEGGRCNSDTVEAPRSDDITRSSYQREYSLLTEAREQGDEKESFVREGLSN